MKIIGKIILYPILALNIFIDFLLVLSSYCSYLKGSFLWPEVSLIELAFPFLAIINLLFLFFWLPVWKKGAIPALLTTLICLVPGLDYCPLHFFGSNDKSDKNEISVLSYNTHSFGISNNNDHSKNNPVIQYISNCGSDIVCLQESENNILRKLKNDKDFLPNYPYTNIGKESSGQMCFSKFPILYSKKIEFGNSSGNSCSYYRILIDNDTVAIYNCHLQSNGLKSDEISDYYGMIENPSDKNKYHGSKIVIKKLLTSSESRAEQADLISQHLSHETAKYIIVCGDLNDTPISYAHRKLKKNMVDAYSDRGFGPGISYNKYKLFYRIDHIIVSKNLKPINCRVDRSIKESDHYPITCTLYKE